MVKMALFYLFVSWDIFMGRPWDAKPTDGMTGI
jgi:hypothetical protein